MQRPIAIFRYPSPRLDEGQVTFLERENVDVARAVAQHDAYLAVINGHGYTLVEAPPLDHHPDGLFVEDTMVVIGSTAVISRPGAPSRRGETLGMDVVARSVGLTPVWIEDPATCDGGDVLVTGRHVFVGQSSRTNSAAVAQFQAVAAATGKVAIGVPVEHCLHLKSAITALPDGSLIALKDHVDQKIFTDLGYTVHTTDEPTGADLLCLNGKLGRTVVVPTSAKRTQAQLRALGFRVETVDVSELVKIEAGVTCMSVLVPSGSSADN